MRFVLPAILAALALAMAGCGSENVAAGPASSAGLLKPGPVVYWQTVSDPGSPQWEQAEDLLGKFPDGDRWLAELEKKLVAEKRITWADDVRPALGDVVDVAVYGEPGAAKPSVVGLTNPDDPDKLLALVQKLNRGEEKPAVTRVVGDWVAISDSQAAIDAALESGGGRSLEDDPEFKAAMEKLPDDALSRFYADPAAAIDVLGSTRKDMRDAFRLLGIDGLDFAAAWAKAKASGVEVAGVLGGEGADRLLGTGDPYSSALVGKVPSDAFAFYTFRGEGVRQGLEQLRSNPLYAMALKGVERELGVSISELTDLFQGEAALYARPGLPIPELTLLLDSDNVEQARASADKALRRIAASAGADVTEDGDVTTAVFEGLPINLTSVDGMVVLTTSKQGIADLEDANVDRLPDSKAYKDALGAADAPAEYTGLAYIDLRQALELIVGYAGISGQNLPENVSRNLEPLESFVAYGTKDGALSKSLAFLEID
jgi:hypothetical protein